MCIVAAYDCFGCIDHTFCYKADKIWVPRLCRLPQCSLIAVKSLDGPKGEGIALSSNFAQYFFHNSALMLSRYCQTVKYKLYTKLVEIDQ